MLRTFWCHIKNGYQFQLWYKGNKTSYSPLNLTPGCCYESRVFATLLKPSQAEESWGRPSNVIHFPVDFSPPSSTGKSNCMKFILFYMKSKNSKFDYAYGIINYKQIILNELFNHKVINVFSDVSTLEQTTANSCKLLELSCL